MRFHSLVDRVAIVTTGVSGAINAAEGKRGFHADGANKSSEEEKDGLAAGGDVHVFVKEATTAMARERGWEGGSEAELVRADAAIITVPLSVLQAGAVEFDPPLHEVRAFVVAVAVFFYIVWSIVTDMITLWPRHSWFRCVRKGKD